MKLTLSIGLTAAIAFLASLLARSAVDLPRGTDHRAARLAEDLAASSLNT